MANFLSTIITSAEVTTKNVAQIQQIVVGVDARHTALEDQLKEVLSTLLRTQKGFECLLELVEATRLSKSQHTLLINTHEKLANTEHRMEQLYILLSEVLEILNTPAVDSPTDDDKMGENETGAHTEGERIETGTDTEGEHVAEGEPIEILESDNDDLAPISTILKRKCEELIPPPTKRHAPSTSASVGEEEERRRRSKGKASADDSAPSSKDTDCQSIIKEARCFGMIPEQLLEERARLQAEE